MTQVTTKSATDKINLLSGQMGDSKLLKIVNRTTRASLAVLFIYVLFLVALMGTQIFIGRKKAEVDSFYQVLVQDVGKLGKQESLVQVAKERAGLAKGIISDVSAPTRILDDVVTTLPSSVSVINVDTEAGGILFSLEAQHSEALVTLLETLKSKELAAVDLESITLGAGGVYKIAVRVR